jgi:riboflavin biosynthesis pyrimidine reductase
MVEGGASVIDTFMNQAFQPRGSGESPVVDTLIVTVAPTIVGDDGLGYTVGVSGDKPSVSNRLVFSRNAQSTWYIRFPNLCTCGLS